MRITVGQVKEMKAKGERIPMLTAYDYATAKLLDEIGMPMLLVGDSLGMVVLGYDSTIPVTMEEMLH
ncbi:MAG: 3-methyl-2-oxobutanoate hydroxymethyltransferase, partial [Chloroflexota bacterium]|nr:3-methyl-2-oxobutanoate hydroxymethyltransferase [Chloroflexota bacterium]